MLRKAIKEHWEERFKIEDPSYLEEQLLKLAECNSYDDLIYHCMSVDMGGHAIIATKIKMSHRDFAFILSVHRSMSQGHIYERSGSFPYKKERTIENGKTIETYTYPDESTVKYQVGV
jgi:hypothetical protein